LGLTVLSAAYDFETVVHHASTQTQHTLRALSLDPGDAPGTKVAARSHMFSRFIIGVRQSSPVQRCQLSLPLLLERSGARAAR